MRLLLALAALLVASSFALADNDCSLVGPAPELALPTGTYVDNDLCQPDCVVAVWIYQESNGIDGLQRRDSAVDDTCWGKFPSDTLVLEAIR